MALGSGLAEAALALVDGRRAAEDLAVAGGAAETARFEGVVCAPGVGAPSRMAAVRGAVLNRLLAKHQSSPS